MRTISLAIVAIILNAHCLGVAQPAQDAQQLFAQLHDAKTTDEAFARLKVLAGSNPDARQYLVTTLPAAITKDLSQGPIWQNPVSANSVRLAGDLRIAEAVPILVQSLDNDLAKRGGFVTSAMAYELNNDPVAKALAKIGEPALGPIRDRLKNNNNSQIERVRTVQILNFMESAGADQVLALQLKSESDPVVRKTIEAVLQKHQKTSTH